MQFSLILSLDIMQILAWLYPLDDSRSLRCFSRTYQIKVTSRVLLCSLERGIGQQITSSCCQKFKLTKIIAHPGLLLRGSFDSDSA